MGDAWRCQVHVIQTAGQPARICSHLFREVINDPAESMISTQQGCRRKDEGSAGVEGYRFGMHQWQHTPQSRDAGRERTERERERT
eukprot:3171751-Rhodomonas_salina.1